MSRVGPSVCVDHSDPAVHPGKATRTPIQGHCSNDGSILDTLPNDTLSQLP